MSKSEPISRTVCPHRCELAASGAPPLLLPRTTILVYMRELCRFAHVEFVLHY